MKYERVWAVYFSATGTTKKIVTAVAGKISDELGLEYSEFDFTFPIARAKAMSFSEADIVVFGVPVIAGRVPNVLLKYFDTFKGGGAPAAPIVLFGNRDFDDALIELKDILEKDGFNTIAAGAFVGEHSFSDILAKGRPDDEDLKEALDFSVKIAEKIKCEDNIQSMPVIVDGTPYPYRDYYQPRDRNGNWIDIRKVVPVTVERCTDCKVCVDLCPLGSIDREDVRILNGICMKCCACIKGCSESARYFDDPGFIYHREELEDVYKRRAENKVFY